eukprot:scaffold159469_cov38-Tisochrysis_lutea.AAC.3
MLCSAPLTSYDATKGMTYGAFLAGAGSVILGVNRAVPYSQYYVGAGLSGAAFDYYCRGSNGFMLDNRLAQEVVAAMLAAYGTTMFLR